MGYIGSREGHITEPLLGSGWQTITTIGQPQLFIRVGKYQITLIVPGPKISSYYYNEDVPRILMEHGMDDIAAKVTAYLIRMGP